MWTGQYMSSLSRVAVNVWNFHRNLETIAMVNRVYSLTHSFSQSDAKRNNCLPIWTLSFDDDYLFWSLTRQLYSVPLFSQICEEEERLLKHSSIHVTDLIGNPHFKSIRNSVINISITLTRFTNAYHRNTYGILQDTPNGTISQL